MRAKIFIAMWIIAIGVTDYFYYQKNMQKGQPHLEIIGDKCGIVEDNFTELRNVKYGTRTEYYLKVRYSTGSEIVSVNAKTWYDSHIGKSVCFIITEPIGLWYCVCLLITWLTVFVLGIFVFVSFLRFGFGFKPYSLIKYINNGSDD